jgi:hypothetical protein
MLPTHSIIHSLTKYDGQVESQRNHTGASGAVPLPSIVIRTGDGGSDEGDVEERRVRVHKLHTPQHAIQHHMTPHGDSLGKLTWNANSFVIIESSNSVSVLHNNPTTSTCKKHVRITDGVGWLACGSPTR